MDKLDPVLLRQLRAKVAEWGPSDRASSNLTSAEASMIIQVIECGIHYAAQLDAMVQRVKAAERLRDQIAKAHQEQVTLRQHAEKEVMRLNAELFGLKAESLPENPDHQDIDPSDVDPGEWVTAEEHDHLRAKVAAMKEIARSIIHLADREEE